MSEQHGSSGALDAVPFTSSDGERGLLLTDPIPDGAPAAVREALARRRIAVTTGRCPCGGRATWPNRAARRAAARAGTTPPRGQVRHAAGCPAPRALELLAAFHGGAR